MLTFPTLGAVFTLKQLEFCESSFILIILAYSGFSTCPQILNPSSAKEVNISPQEMMLATSH